MPRLSDGTYDLMDTNSVIKHILDKHDEVSWFGGVSVKRPTYTSRFTSEAETQSTPKPSDVAKTAASRVQPVHDPDEHKEYAADKFMHDTFKRRDEMKQTHSYDAMVRKYIESGEGK